MGTFSSGLVGNNIACARSDVYLFGRYFSLPDAFVDGDELLSHEFIRGDEKVEIILGIGDYEDASFDVYTKDNMKKLFGNWLMNVKYAFPRVFTFEKQLERILQEASELNDCDKDMDKIRELKRKYMDTFNKLFEYFAEIYYTKKYIQAKHKKDNYDKIVTISVWLYAILTICFIIKYTQKEELDKTDSIKYEKNYMDTIGQNTADIA